MNSRNRLARLASSDDDAFIAESVSGGITQEQICRHLASRIPIPRNYDSG